MDLIRLVSNLIFKIEKGIVCILIPVMVFSLFFDVLFRYIINSPLVWAQEIALFTFIWVSFIGASMSIKVKEAVAVSILVDKLKGFPRNALIIIGLLISAAFIIQVTSISIEWIMNPNILLQKSVTTQIPMIIPYLCIPVTLIFMSIHLIYLLFEAIQTSSRKKVIE